MADSCASECRVVQLWPSDNINVFCVSVGKTKKIAFEWKDAIFDFLFPQVVQKH